MARMLGKTPENLTPGEELMYSFVQNELPDYICASVNPDIISDTGNSHLEIDMLILIPHMGAYILDIKDASGFTFSEGTYQYLYRNGQTRSMTPKNRHGRLKSQVYALRDYLKKTFNITPLVYEFECFPFMDMEHVDATALPPDFDARHVITADDLKSGLTFLHKIIGCTIYDREVRGVDYYEDLSDKDAHDLFYFWDTGLTLPPRPDRPPVVFLSYNRFNNEMSKDVQTVLEDRGVFVWRAPKDVPGGCDYFPHEMQAIGECDLFLILLSRTAQESAEVRKEFEKALELKKNIFPVWIEETSDSDINPYYREKLAKYQYRVMPKIDIEVIREIVSAVRKAKREIDPH